jgi:glycosyltransferase involved in cell wall biosynthesis
MIRKPKDNPTRILRIMHRINVGGPTFHAALLTSYMNPEIWETKLLAGKLSKGEKSGEYILDQYDVSAQYIPGMYRSVGFYNDLRAFVFIYSMIREYRPTVLHTHASKSGFLGRIAGFILGVPVIVHTYHGNVFKGYWSSPISMLAQFIERILAKITTKIVTISQSQYNEIVNEFKISDSYKTKVIPLGLDLQKFKDNIFNKRKLFRKKYGVDKEICIGILGRLDSVKNHQLLLKSFAYAKSRTGSRVVVFIIGDGIELEGLFQLSSNLKLSYKYKNDSEDLYDVNFMSWREDIDTILSGLDLMALTSLNEGTPVSLIEAQVSGLPIITTNVGGVSDIVMRSKNNKIINSFSEDVFGEELLSLLSRIDIDELRVPNMEVFKKYNYNRLVNDIEQLYLDLIKDENT